MSDDANKNIKSENKRQNEYNLYDFRVTYNQKYVTHLEYFSESTLEINKKLNSDINEDNLKSEDTTSDDREFSDPDISSCIKEEKTEVETSKVGKAKVTEVDEKVSIFLFLLSPC